MQSKRTWSTAFERKQYGQQQNALCAYFEQEFESSSSSSSSASESSSSSVSSLSTSSSSNNDSDADQHSSSSSSSDDDDEDLPMELARNIHNLEERINTNIREADILYGRLMLIKDASEGWCLSECRFRKVDLQDLSDKLWPRMVTYFQPGSTKDRIVLPFRYTGNFETCLLMYLYRLAKPRTVMGQMEGVFHMSKSHISACLKGFSDAMYRFSRKYLCDVRIWQHRFHIYADAIYRKVGRLNNIWAFIDGTCRPICRPKRFQRRVYTRYKRCHALKFQSVVVPEGFIAHLKGPYPGARHDARVLQESGLIAEIQELIPNGDYKMYGDCAYPWSPWIEKGFLQADPNSPEAAFNNDMSSARVAVEWGFSGLLNQWTFLNFTNSMKVFLFPVGQYFVNAAFLQNLRTCYYGNLINDYFALKPMTIDEYLALPSDYMIDE